jgi:CubicO group peptidase (beta-lactamase class C family)
MPRVRPLTTFALTIAAAGCLAAQQPHPQHAVAADRIVRAVDTLAARAVAAGVTPALGLAIVMDGKTLFTKGYGWVDATAKVPANEQTLWYLASTSKSYTGFGVSLLATQGRLAFSDPIAKLLPGVEWPSFADPTKLTLANFLSHTHHINDNAVVQSAAFTGAIPEARWPSLIKYATPQGNDDLIYSNFGYNVAAMVIDRLRPEGWRKYLDSAVYKPVGMNETYTRVSGLEARIAKPHTLATAGFVTIPFDKTDETMNSAGGHVATLHDLARWTIVQMDGGRIDGRQVFPAQAVALAHTLIARQTRDAAKRFGPFDREGWGAGWDLGTYNGEPMVSRFGGYNNTRSHLSFLPARHIGFVAMVTGPGSSGLTDVLATLAYDLEAGKPDAEKRASAQVDQMAATISRGRAQVAAGDSVRRSRQVPLRHPVSAFAGSYFNEALGTITFTATGSGLRYRWGVLGGPAEVYDAAKDQLRVEVAGTGTVVSFRFNGDGPAKAIVVQGDTYLRR